MKSVSFDANFLKIDDESFCRYDAARFVVWSAPYEHTSSYHAGSAAGPAAILRASQFVEYYDEELGQETFRRGGICTLEPVDFTNAIDEAAVRLVEERTARLLAEGKFPVMLGAEHTVTFGAVRAFQRAFPDLGVLQIDAHSDLRESYQGNPYSHACVMARVYDLGVPIVQIGIRAQCREEAELARSSGRIHTVYAHEVRSRPLDDWIHDAVQRLPRNVYVTIDADGFDPSVIPAVGTPEPNGLTWHEGVALLRAAFQARRVVGFDVVEVAPMPPSTISEYTLAKLVYKLIGLKTLSGEA